MAEAKATVPHFYLNAEIDMTRAVQMRADLNGALDGTGEKISCQRPGHRGRGQGARRAHGLPPLVGRRQARLPPARARRHRGGARRGPDRPGHARRRHEGRARDRPSRLASWPAAPARASSSRTRSRAARSPSRTSACSASRRSMPIINPPEPGILAVGAIVERPVVRDGEIVRAADHGRDALDRPPRRLGRRRRALPRHVVKLLEAACSCSPDPPRPTSVISLRMRDAIRPTIMTTNVADGPARHVARRRRAPHDRA